MLTIEIAFGILLGGLMLRYYSKQSRPFQAVIADFLVWVVFLGGTVFVLVGSGVWVYSLLEGFDLGTLLKVITSIVCGILSGFIYAGLCIYVYHVTENCRQP